MAATSTGLAPNERDTLFKTLQGLIQNGDVPLEDLNSLVAELNQTTIKAEQDSFHDSHLSDIFAADEFGDFAATEGSSDQSDLFAAEGASEWPDESEDPFPDDFIAVEAAFQDPSEQSQSSSRQSKSRGRNSSDTGTNARGRSRNTRSKPKKTAEDVLSSTWEPFDVQDSSAPPNTSTPTSTPTIRRKSKVEGTNSSKQPSKKRETEERSRDTNNSNAPVTAESARRRTSSSHRKSRESDLDPTKTREKTRSLSRKKKDGSSRDDTKKLDAALVRMVSEDNLTTSGDTATTSSETKASEEAHKKSPRRKVVKKVAAGIRADDVSTILKAIESGMIETNAAGKIVVRMGKKKSEGTSLSRVLDAQKVANGGLAENRSISSAPVQATERLPGSPAAAAQRRRSRSRKSRPEGTEEESSLRERSKSQGRRSDPV